MGGGWEVLGINETMGGTNRPDVVYVNHATKQFLVEDLYTGAKRNAMTASGPTSQRHYQKTLAYSKEPVIAQLTSQGYVGQYWDLPSQLVH